MTNSRNKSFGLYRRVAQAACVLFSVVTCIQQPPDNTLKEPEKQSHEKKTGAAEKAEPDLKKCRQGEKRNEKNECVNSAAQALQREPLKKERPVTLNQKLLQFYTKRANYDVVYQQVLQFYPDGKTNGCVAFLSTALRNVGVQVPHFPPSTKKESPSLVTRPFSKHLEYTLGWKRITNYRQLEPGDIVFTIDAKGYPGYPAHTYMFQEWLDASKNKAYVVDNQDFTHVRDVLGYGNANFSPFQYALRAP